MEMAVPDDADNAGEDIPSDVHLRLRKAMKATTNKSIRIDV